MVARRDLREHLAGRALRIVDAQPFVVPDALLVDVEDAQGKSDEKKGDQRPPLDALAGSGVAFHEAIQ
jgi:hypothetical protein